MTNVFSSERLKDCWKGRIDKIFSAVSAKSIASAAQVVVE
jgi:hypothetical protein